MTMQKIISSVQGVVNRCALPRVSGDETSTKASEKSIVKEIAHLSAAYSKYCLKQKMVGGVLARFNDANVHAGEWETVRPDVQEYNDKLFQTLRTIDEYYEFRNDSRRIDDCSGVTNAFKDLTEKKNAIKGDIPVDVQNSYEVVSIVCELITNGHPTKEQLFAIRDKAESMKKKIKDTEAKMDIIKDNEELFYRLDRVIGDANYRLDEYYDAGPIADATLRIYINNKDNFKTLADLFAKCSTDDVDVSMIKKGGEVEVQFVIKNRRKSTTELIKGIEEKVSNIIIDNETFKGKPLGDKTFTQILRRVKWYFVEVVGPNAEDDDFNSNFRSDLCTYIFGRRPTTYNYKQADL